jgi:hypothetical protein
MTETKKQDQPEGNERCYCGAVLRKTDPKDPLSDFVCPMCGTKVSHDMTELSAADTQMLSIKEMARMAQEGVDASAVSGEWVTTLDHKDDTESDEKG